MPIHKGYGGVSIGYDRESVLEGQINGSYVHKSVHTFDMNKVIVCVWYYFTLAQKFLISLDCFIGEGFNFFPINSSTY